MSRRVQEINWNCTKALNKEVKTVIIEFVGAILILFSAFKKSSFNKSSRTLKKTGLPVQDHETLSIQDYGYDFS